MAETDTQMSKPTDEKDRVLVHAMTDRELLEEVVHTMRFLADGMAEIQKQGIGGMMKSMLGGGNGK